MIIDSRRVLGGFAIFGLVLLRLVIGWHFWCEGSKKVEYDTREGGLRMVFSADEDFLQRAKGPLAPLYFAHATSDHEWRDKLASPRENVPLTPEQLTEQSTWIKDYAKRRADAKAAKQAAPVEFAPHTATHDWATKVAADWRNAVNRFSSIAGVSDAQKQKAEEALTIRLGQLSDFVGGIEGEVAEYRHELWRLANWNASPEAGEDSTPFVEARIKTKTAETTGKPIAWRKEVREYEDNLGEDLKGILTQEQQNQAATISAVENAMADAHSSKLGFINLVATIVTIGVGICLILGLFTRFASIVGAMFLFGVIASQPFWVEGTAPTINFCVEFAGLLVLAGTGAGHWWGMDGCLAALFGRRRTLVAEEV